VTDPRDEEIAELRRQLAEKDAVIAQLRAELAALKEAFAKSSRNSSKPPSSDGPGAKARPKKSPSGRKPGGQPGHKRHERVLVPPEKVHEVVPCIPKQCDACAGLLHGQDPEPHRHQVFELPPVEPVVTEVQQHALGCGLCGHRTVGKLPEGVSTRAFGPTVDAVVAVYIEGVEPTNNGAEQVARHGVIMRKISYGTHSVAGSRFVERMLTVHATLRRQHRKLLDFMRSACTAALRRHPAPSTLPIEAPANPLRRAA